MFKNVELRTQQKRYMYSKCRTIFTEKWINLKSVYLRGEKKIRTFQKTWEKDLWSLENYVKVTGKTDKHGKQESGCHESCKQPKDNDEIMRKYEKKF